MRSASRNTARSGRERHKRTHVVVRSPSSSSPRHSPPEPEAIAVEHGDITVADTRSGDRFRLAVTLQAPGHPLTTVTHRALQRTVRGLLQRRAPAAGSALASSVQLTIDGVELSESQTVTVPNGTVVEVHRTAHGRRSLSSAVAPSEREVSLRSPPHDTTRTGPRRAAPQRNKSASPPRTVATAKARAAIAAKRLASPPSPAAAAASPPTRRLPLRRAADTRSVSSRLPTSPGSDAALAAAHAHLNATSTAHTSKGLRRGPASKDASSTASSPHDFRVMKPQAASAASHSPTATGSSRGGGAHTTSTGTSNTWAGRRSVSPIQRTASVRSANGTQPPPRQEEPLRPASSSRHGSFSDDAHEGTHDRTPTESYSADTTAFSSGDSTTGPGDGAAAPQATPDMPSPPAHASPTPGLPRAEHSALQTAEQTVTTATQEAQRPPLTPQEVYAAQRSAIAAAAAAEQRRVLTRLQHHCRALEEEKRALLTTRLAALKAQESAVRLRTLRAAQEAAATAEADDVRVRLGEHRDALLTRWLRVLHAHASGHYAMPTPLLRELEDEGDGLTLHCLSSIAAHHTQRARLQALRQQRVLQETAVARLRWEAHVRRCTAEERRGCLRVVAPLRPPSRRAWLPPSVVASGAVAEMDGGYAVRVVPAATAAASMREVELVDPPRNVRRRYTVWAAYDAAAAPSPTRGAATASPQSPPPPPLPQQLFKEQLQPLLAHMCRTGQHVAVLAFGAVGSGKTHTLLGPRAIALPPASASNTPAGKPRTAAASPPAPAIGARLDARSSSSSSDLYTYDSAGDSGGVDDDNDVNPPTGITRAGPQEPLGITRCLDPADAAVEAAVMQSVAAAEAAVRQRHVDARDAREEREWRTQAGIAAEDGLLPRAVAWLTAHLRDAAPHGAAGTADTAVVESLRMSVYEVYDDHVYDLLPTPPPADAKGGSDDGKPAWAAWPRWNPGWLPGPHVKNSNPEQLTELQLELAPASTPATVSQLLQQAAPPQWRVRASEVAVRSATEALQVLQLGLHRRRTAAAQRSATSSRSHLYVRFRVEVQRPVMPGKASCTAAAAVHALEREEAAPPASGEGLGQPKGYGFLRAALAASSADAEADIGKAAAPSLVPPTCVAELLFTDFAGSERVELGGHAGEALREAQGIHASLSAVADVLTALARANPRRQEQQHQQQQTTPEPAARQSTATLVARWGAATTRPGITLARGPPVFLQPRLAPAGSRSRAERDGAVTLRRRVLTLMDTHMAADAAAQWWRQWRSAAPYVPFRACKTTQLLQSTLGAPCKTLVLACVRPCSVTEVVLPASPHDRAGGPRLRATATALFAHQAPAMLSETRATLDLAARLHDAAQGDGTDDEKAAARRRQ